MKPVLIYQMGKVASTSIFAALNEIKIESHHIHTFTPKNKFRKPKWYTKTNEILRSINSKNGRWKIICPIREPISRAISAFFEIYKPASNVEQDPLNIDCSQKLCYTTKLDELIKNFKVNPRFNEAEGWFEKELNYYFGIDVFSESFDKEAGYKIYKNENAEVLVFRFEDIQRIGEESIRYFLNFKNIIKIPHYRKTKDRHPLTINNMIKHVAQFYKNDIKHIYQSRYVRHFYGDREINIFKNKFDM